MSLFKVSHPHIREARKTYELGVKLSRNFMSPPLSICITLDNNRMTNFDNAADGEAVVVGWLGGVFV